MNIHQNKVRALGLCSGGLDSILAAILLQKQGIDVEWITFVTPFFSSDKAEAASKMVQIPLTILNITVPYLTMLKNPPCGYGQNMNPCMDCHSMMFRMAGDVMKERGMQFLFSGEVLGQRPMSQTRSSLKYVEKHSGCKDYIVRPLSARLLDETIVEAEGLVQRERLLGLSGRSRKPQMALAKEWGITRYPTPAGGCLLTDAGYSRRLKDLFDHQDTCTENELYLLKYGRHIRLNDRVKIIVGRTHQDNANILNHYDATRDILLKTRHIPGPVVLVSGWPDTALICRAAEIAAGYSKALPDTKVEIAVATPEAAEMLQVTGKRPDTSDML